jgi:hypothetical protein
MSHAYKCIIDIHVYNTSASNIHVYTSASNIHDGYTSKLRHYHYPTICITLDRQRATYTQSDQVWNAVVLNSSLSMHE